MNFIWVFIRRIREHNTRKTGREDTTRDLINGLLVSSDPLITGRRQFRKLKRRALSPEAELLVVIPENAGVTGALGDSLSEVQQSEDTESETSDWET